MQPWRNPIHIPSIFITPVNVPPLSSDACSLIQMDLEVVAFAADWKHCDQVANYMARAVSFDRADTFLYSNQLSTVLNELLEIAFYQHRVVGALRCTLFRDGPLDRIEMRIPVDALQSEFYRNATAAAQSPDVAELYTRSLLGEGVPEHLSGFLELAADYGAGIWLEELDGGTELRLVADLHFEEDPSQVPPSLS